MRCPKVATYETDIDLDTVSSVKYSASGGVHVIAGVVPHRYEIVVMVKKVATKGVIGDRRVLLIRQVGDHPSQRKDRPRAYQDGQHAPK